MKLRTRLIIAFFIILIMPVVLFALIGSAVVAPQLHIMAQTYGLDNELSSFTGTSFKIVTAITNALERRVLEEINENPDQFLDKSFLDELNETFESKNSYLVLRVDDEYQYIGTNQVSIDIINAAVLDDTVEVYDFAEEAQQVYSFVDVSFSDGRTGEIYIFTKIDNQLPEIKTFMYSLLTLAVLILAATAGVLVTWIYRSIIRPIGSLRVAAQNIRDGNLDFDMEIRSDEMGELAADFDTMRKRLKDNAQEKVEFDAENKQLISNISHDLKTPLTAIKGYVEGIMDGVADTPEKMDRYIRTIYAKANDMDKLIDELTLYSRIDTNRIPYNFVQLDVAEYFEDCAYDLETELTAKGIGFAYFNYIAEDTQVIADPEQLKRVINNIISNSVKYMDKKKGFITLKLSENEDCILIEEEDNGRGISQKDLPNIFDRFYRADSSRNSAQGGSGIGLAIVKKIVEDHGGRIWATSKEHTGTVMHIELRKVTEQPRTAL